MMQFSSNDAWRRTGLRAPVRLPASGKQIETRSARIAATRASAWAKLKVGALAKISRGRKQASLLKIFRPFLSLRRNGIAGGGHHGIRYRLADAGPAPRAAAPDERLSDAGDAHGGRGHP